MSLELVMSPLVYFFLALAAVGLIALLCFNLKLCYTSLKLRCLFQPQERARATRTSDIDKHSAPTSRSPPTSTTIVKFENETQTVTVKNENRQIKPESREAQTQTPSNNSLQVLQQQARQSKRLSIAWKFHQKHTRAFRHSKNQQIFFDMLNIQAKLIENQRGTLGHNSSTQLLICVDARPVQVGGFCVDFDQKIGYLYSHKVPELPWKLMDCSSNSNEFEMKNLLFALLLWEDKIKASKNVQIFTDCSAIKLMKCSHAQRVRGMIEHLKLCDGVQINRDLWCFRSKNNFDFAKYIIPADDLSRGRISKCEEFLRHFYGIATFVNTSCPTNVTDDAGKHVKVLERLEWWINNPCENCQFALTDANTWTGS